MKFTEAYKKIIIEGDWDYLMITQRRGAADDYVDIVKNANKKEISELIKMDKFDSLRMGITKNLDIYYWPGNDALHYTVTNRGNFDFILGLEYSKNADDNYQYSLFSNTKRLEVNNKTNNKILKKLNTVLPEPFIRKYKTTEEIKAANR